MHFKEFLANKGVLYFKESLNGAKLIRPVHFKSYRVTDYLIRMMINIKKFA